MQIRLHLRLLVVTWSTISYSEFYWFKVRADTVCSCLIYFKIKLCLVVTLDFFSTKFSINDIYGNLLTYNVHFMLAEGFHLRLPFSVDYPHPKFSGLLILLPSSFIVCSNLSSSVNNMYNKNLLTLWLIITWFLLTSSFCSCFLILIT